MLYYSIYYSFTLVRLSGITWQMADILQFLGQLGGYSAQTLNKRCLLGIRKTAWQQPSSPALYEFVADSMCIRDFVSNLKPQADH